MTTHIGKRGRTGLAQVDVGAENTGNSQGDRRAGLQSNRNRLGPRASGQFDVILFALHRTFTTRYPDFFDRA
jgi:hypothetical protein